MKHAIINAVIYTGAAILQQKVLLIADGKILGIEDQLPQSAADGDLANNWQIHDLQGKNISAGLIDIQINGGYSQYFTQDPGEKSLSDINQACLDFGTLNYLTTLISSTAPVILQAIDAVRQYKTKHPDSGLMGMHLEGPFFNPAKRGAHDAAIVRLPTDRELRTIVEAGRDVIKVMTIAPEMFSLEQIKYLQDNGILLSAGHSNMEYEQAQRYFDNGIHLVTHLYNAMSSFGHRAPGLTGAALERQDVYTALILDGHHCHYGAARLAERLKGEQLFLITDSSFLGRKMKNFKWGNFDAVLTDGTYRNHEGNLAGAAISLPEAIQNAVAELHVPLQQAIEMATSRVAKAIGMQDEIGFIKKGYPARFFVFEAPLEDDNFSSLIL